MKQRHHSRIKLVASAFILLLVGCQGVDSAIQDAGIKQAGITSIHVTPSSMHLKGIGTQVDLSLVVSLKSGLVVTNVQDSVFDPVANKSHSVSWATDNPFVVDFTEPGLLTAISAGEATIRASIGSILSEAEVSVEAAGSLDPVDVESSIVLHVALITINPSDIMLEGPGAIAHLTSTLLYSDNLTQEGINRYYYHPNGTVSGQISWASSDTSVAKVSAYGVVQAVSPGEAVIYVDDPWNEIFPTDEIIVIVNGE